MLHNVLKKGGLLVLSLLVIPLAFAAETGMYDSINWTSPVTYLQLTTFWIILLTIILVAGKSHVMNHKKFFFFITIIPVILVTVYLAGHTVHHNITSATGGPVHWHADYQIFVCGERLDLIDPKFPSNKIGSPLFHEHNDDRIHVEGAVMHLEDVDVGSYFEVIGGELTATSLKYTTNDGEVSVQNGDLCNGVPSELAVYVNGNREADPANYLYYPDPLVPPGDCIIVEFGPNPGSTTSKICESWEAQGWTYDNYEQKREER